MNGNKRNQNFIYVSDSEAPSSNEDDDVEYDDKDETINISSDDSESEWSDEEEKEEVDDDDVELTDEEEKKEEEEGVTVSPVDDQARCDRVVDLLKGRHDLQILTLEECKSYLRKHELRLAGTKAICMERILEHWRIKDRNGEKLYPRSSIRINCTGDVCRGDVIMFTQRVYKKFDKMKRSGNIAGKRTIVGRVVKESYGAEKQQHTFTVEVLWSKGLKRLPPLFPLLVKGRNLYRMRTYRQCWSNEADRSKVLAEKHKRGSEARQFRALKKASMANRGPKSHSHNCHKRKPSPKRCKTQESTAASASNTRNYNKNHGRGKAPILKPAKVRKSMRPRNMWSPPRDVRQPTHNQIGTYMYQQHTLQSPLCNQYRSQMPPQYNGAFIFPSGISSTSTAIRCQQGHSHGSYAQHSHTRPIPRMLPQFEDQAIFEMHRGMSSNSIRCSVPGCGDYGTSNCIFFACWRCCRRTGRRCDGHHQCH